MSSALSGLALGGASRLLSSRGGSHLVRYTNQLSSVRFVFARASAFPRNEHVCNLRQTIFRQKCPLGIASVYRVPCEQQVLPLDVFRLRPDGWRTNCLSAVSSALMVGSDSAFVMSARSTLAMNVSSGRKCA